MHILSGWSDNIGLWVSLIVGAGWYAAGVARLYNRGQSGGPIGKSHIAAFSAGMAILFIVLVSPFDAVADQLFWVHMVQHLALLLVATPLLIMGRPALAFLWAFGGGGRRRVGWLWKAFGLRRGLAVAMHPIVVWLLFCGAFVVWHFPGPYQWALRDENIHTLEHVTFFVSALMFWSLVVEPSGVRRLDYGPTLVFVVTAAILSGLPGALIALAPRPLYPAHAAGDAAWGLTLLEDQQLAGIVMWIPGGLVYLIAAGWVFVKWLQQDERRRPALRRALPLMALCCLAPIALSGCGKSDAAETGARRGARLISAYGCGGCHTIPGVAQGNGVVGPPLTMMGRRTYIAGMLRNTSDNMVAWLRSPQSIVPGNVMPDMSLSEGDARDIASYLESLH
ncbi:MAG TPA: cytochrome c oxidase assembly protein [Stellaceae bacterium]|jgi:cytochrome c oxidase assembly factor CtaG/cytochrome c2|nr:cytochrome c oxidase assembly protein [Stellaceae bacterium]